MNWNAFAAIWTALSAIATFSACAIALYQTRMSNHKYLKLKPLKNYIIKNSIECSNKKYSGLSITNIGNKTVYVTSFGYRIDGDKGFAYINPHLSTDGVITPFVPHALNPEQSLTFLVEKPIVDGYLMPEFAAKKKIKLFCSDSTNNFYYVRIKKEFCT